jgi:hypothetical protein
MTAARWDWGLEAQILALGRNPPRVSSVRRACFFGIGAGAAPRVKVKACFTSPNSCLIASAREQRRTGPWEATGRGLPSLVSDV